MQINLIPAKTWREEDELGKDEKEVQQHAFGMKHEILPGSNFNRLKLHLFFFLFSKKITIICLFFVP